MVVNNRKNPERIDLKANNFQQGFKKKRKEVRKTQRSINFWFIRDKYE